MRSTDCHCKLIGWMLFVAVTCLLPANLSASEPQSLVGLRSEEQKLAPPAQYGVERLTAALKERDIQLAADAPNTTSKVLVVGTYQGSEKIRHWVDAGDISLKKQPEALAVKRMRDGDQTLLVVVGYDDVGLMYALLDLADQVAHASDAVQWFESARETSETPHNAMRRMRVLMHHAANEKDWYHSKEYWDWYIGMLATNRFNGLNLVYSHQTPYMAPMYAWHLKIDEFPDVRPRGVSDEEREHNLEVMRHIAKLCQERGIELTVGVWQHLPWIHSYLKTRPDQEVLIDGLNGDNVGRYSYLAVKKLLEECPGIARIQLRPNDESGIALTDQTAFYRDNVIRAIQESPRGVKLDLRTVGVQESTIQAARCGEFRRSYQR